MSDRDPPRYTPERPIAWILLFINFLMKCGVDIMPQASRMVGCGVIASADPDLRQKLARRMGLAQDSNDAALVGDIDEKEAAERAASVATSLPSRAAASHTSGLEAPAVEIRGMDSASVDGGAGDAGITYLRWHRPDQLPRERKKRCVAR